MIEEHSGTDGKGNNWHTYKYGKSIAHSDGGGWASGYHRSSVDTDDSGWGHHMGYDERSPAEWDGSSHDWSGAIQQSPYDGTPIRWVATTTDATPKITTVSFRTLPWVPSNSVPNDALTTDFIRGPSAWMWDKAASQNAQPASIVYSTWTDESTPAHDKGFSDWGARKWSPTAIVYEHEKPPQQNVYSSISVPPRILHQYSGPVWQRSVGWGEKLGFGNIPTVPWVKVE
ncbi:hypothetical protein Tcan_08787 [Toxocara canis]|uniref:Uncharacterized protein n=2 Tax=Toxocara canis TaxID=6265 RepID=A0A0B2UZP2_TOXCA|nr:hypothetical protein Tcan_08787 [Toxocara canis]VDM44779.1 unnamed protein product [Toxocara canis]